MQRRKWISLASPFGEIRSDSIGFAARRLPVTLMSANVPIIQRILVRSRLTAFVTLSRYRRCCDKRTINIGAITAKGTQTTAGFRHIAGHVK